MILFYKILDAFIKDQFPSPNQFKVYLVATFVRGFVYSEQGIYIFPMKFCNTQK